MQAFKFLVHTISVFYGNMLTIGNSVGYRYGYNECCTWYWIYCYICIIMSINPLYTEMVGCLNKYGSSIFKWNNQYV